MNTLYIGTGALALAILGTSLWWMTAGDDRNTPIVNAEMHGAASASPPMAAGNIVVPAFSQAASMGRWAYDENCAACHGRNAAGTDQGPPLVHAIYEPSHHGDLAFHLAAKNGVRAHHWRFGNMPPAEGVTEKQIDWIVTYVRELQRANGID